MSPPTCSPNLRLRLRSGAGPVMRVRIAPAITSPAANATTMTAPVGASSRKEPNIPAALAALPATQPAADLWWRSILGCLATPTLQAIAFSTGIALLTNPEANLPVILGGWHPSLLPDQTLAAEYVDIVVRGQGEDALLEIVQRLEAQGFVSRQPNPRDGRGTLAAITDSGREVMEAATADLVQGGFGMGMLTPDEQDQLFALLRKVRVARGDFAE